MKGKEYLLYTLIVTTTLLKNNRTKFYAVNNYDYQYTASGFLSQNERQSFCFRKKLSQDQK